MATDATPEPLPHFESQPDSSSSLQAQAPSEAVVTLPWGSLCCDRVLEDWAYLLVSIRTSITFDEWSAVVIARTVEYGDYVEPQETESLGQDVRRVLLAASTEVDVTDHQQLSMVIDGSYWDDADPYDASMLPDQAWALIKTLDDMPDYQRLTLVREMQQAFDVAVEEHLSLVKALEHVGLIRP